MKQPIIFIHGLNSSPTIFAHLHSELPSHEAIFIEYDSFQSVEESYQYILTEIKKKKAVVVGHSLGGVLGALLASRDNGLNVEKLVTISAPFGGSLSALAARLLFPRLKVFRDLDPKSEITNEVSSAKIPNHLSIISVSGSLPIMLDDNDSVVTIASQKAAQTALTLDVESNHFEVVQSAQTISAIQNFLFRS